MADDDFLRSGRGALDGACLGGWSFPGGVIFDGEGTSALT